MELPLCRKASEDDEPNDETLDLIRRAREVLGSGGTLDDVCSLLRAQGLPKVSSMVFLAKHLNLRLSEAKDQVHFSPAWRDRQGADDEFHIQLERALEEMEREDSRPPPT